MIIRASSKGTLIRIYNALDGSLLQETHTVSELKDFVKKLNSLPEMTRHIILAQHLSTFTSKPSFLGRLDMEHTILEAERYDICFEYIEEMIHKQEPLVNILRLLILFSITNSGLPKRNFDYLRRELLHSYGFEHMGTLRNTINKTRPVNFDVGSSSHSNLHGPEDDERNEVMVGEAVAVEGGEV